MHEKETINLEENNSTSRRKRLSDGGNETSNNLVLKVGNRKKIT